MMRHMSFVLVCMMVVVLFTGCMSYHHEFKNKDVDVAWSWNKSAQDFWTKVAPVNAGDTLSVQMTYWRREGLLTTPVYTSVYAKPHESILPSVPDSMLVRWGHAILSDSVGFKPDTTRFRFN